MKLHPDIWIDVFNEHGVNLEKILKDTAVHSSTLYDNGVSHFVIGTGYTLVFPTKLTQNPLYNMITQDVLETMQDYIVMQPRPVWEEYLEQIKKVGPDYN